MSTSYWLDRSKSHKNYDVVIVGAGITGLSTAFWLQKEDPSLKIAIVEKSRLGFGASGRNAGFITCGSVEHFNRMISKHGLERATEIWRFAEENMELLKEHVVKDFDQIDFEQKGAYSLAAQTTEFEELKKVAQTMTTLKIPVEVLSSAQIKNRLGAIDFVGGIKYIKDGAVHPVKMLNQLYSLLKVDLYEQTEAFQIESTAQDTRLLKTDNGTFEASMLIFNLNGYSANLHPYFKDKIFPTRGQVLMMQPVEPFMDGPCYANFYLDYFRQLKDGSLLIGGFRQLEKETEVGFSDHVTDVIQQALHQFVKTHLPNYANKAVTHRWAGIMGFSKDGEPMVGSLPQDNQVYFAGGYTGHGIGLAFNTSKKLVDAIFGRSVPMWLSARRFM
jgi:gamma-glutamylputrescine oxidase